MTAHFKEEELLYLVTLFFFQISISILSKLKSNFKLKKKIQVKRIQNNDCKVDTYRLFFETQGRKYGRNLSWPCMNNCLKISNVKSKPILSAVESDLISERNTIPIASVQFWTLIL